MSQPLLIDLGQVSCGCANHALEELHKAVAAPPDDDDLLWRPHENPLIREHLEDCTLRIGARLQQILDVLLGVLQGQAIPQDLLKAHSWTRWTDAERRVAARTLEGKSPSEYSLEDWLTLVDLILQRYLPDDVIAEDAEYLSARAQLAGQVQAALPPDLHLETTLLRLATILPATLAAAGRIGALVTPLQRTVAEFARVRAAELIADLGDAVRRQIKAAIIDHHEALALGETRSYQQLEQRLRDQFGALNRDWRRIAITEVALPIPTIATNGTLSWASGAPPTGTHVAVTGRRRPEYFCLQDFPQDRAHHQGRELPRRVVLRRFDVWGR